MHHKTTPYSNWVRDSFVAVVPLFPAQEIAVRVHPNPARNWVRVQVPGSAATDWKMDLVAVTRKLLERKRLPENGEIDISALEAGVFFLRVYHADRAVIRKLMVY